MMTDRAIVEYWGAHNLVRWNATGINWGDVPVETRNFLTNIGLPIVTDWTLKFGPGGLFIPESVEHSKEWIIEGDSDDFMFLDSQHEWEVRTIQQEAGRNWYVNRTVRCLAECLIEFRSAELDIENMRNTTEGLNRIAAAEFAMRCVDETAFITENSLWGLLLNDLRG